LQLTLHSVQHRLSGHVIVLAILLPALSVHGCDDDEQESIDAASEVASDDSRGQDGLSCPPPVGVEATCILGSPSTNCGDQARVATCVEGSYVCPPNSYSALICTCWGPHCPLDGGIVDLAADTAASPSR
jgi:hypothetical protein